MGRTDLTRPRHEVERAVRDLLRSPPWADFSPEDVNAGLCEDFANDLLELLAARRVRGAVLLYTTTWEDLPGHAWVCVRGRHFDAEVPRGVDRRLDLPIFRRHPAARALWHPVERRCPVCLPPRLSRARP
jgi:hypothetical protein